MLRLNSPPRCRSSGTGWKLARVRCVAGSNTSLRHLFCKSVVIAHPKRQFLISSIRGEVRKKHNCIDQSFCCFPAHVNEPDRFEPSAPKTRMAQALRLNFGCPREDREDEPGDNPWVRNSRHPCARPLYRPALRRYRPFTRSSTEICLIDPNRLVVERWHAH